MSYDIARFKSAFGYKSSVVGLLAETLARKVELDPHNVKLKRLQEAVDLQHALLLKTAKLEQINSGTKNFIAEINAKKLEKEIGELRENPLLDEAEPQLKLLQDLYEAESKLAGAEGMMLGILQTRVVKARKLLDVGTDFSTASDEDSSTPSRPSLEQVLRGGGELELDKKYKGSDGEDYSVAKAIAGGGHSAFKLVNDSGEEFLWKPAANPMMLDVEVGASKMSDLLMPGLVPPCGKLTINGLVGTVQPFVKGADDNVKVDKLTPVQQQQMVAHMLTDWLISNHDNHLKQFLFDESGNLIGIDKGQAFKYFKQGDIESTFVKQAQDKAKMNKDNIGLREQCLRDVEPEDLDPNYFPHSNIGMPVSGEFMREMHRSMEGVDIKTGVVAEAIERAKSLTLETLRELLGGYADKAFPGQQEEFLAAVLKRAKNLDKQLANLQLSAPELATHHETQVAELLDGKKFKPGTAPLIKKELGPLRTAINNLKNVKGIEAATAPGEGEDPTPLYKLQQQLKRLEDANKLLVEIGKDCDNCEKYLSSEYRRVSPLLAAFEVLKIDPAVHADPKYKYTEHEDKLLQHWRELAVARGLADKGAVESWDKSAMSDTYETVRSMARVWSAFPEPELPSGTVTRGDVAEHLMSNYAALDLAKNGLEDGEHAVNISLSWPGVMSTTVGDPRQHNFIQKKSFVWSFTVAKPCPGRVIGDINPSEQEVTFPVGSKVTIKTLVVRKNDKTLRSGEFGDQAVLIALAELG